MAQATGREIQLDVMRGIAILLAMGWHLNAAGDNPLWNLLMLPGSLVGWAGVDMFFVLSGFLVGRLILQEIVATGRFAYRRFFVRRAFRLWPVLYLFLALQPVFGRFPWQDYLLQTALHVQNYFDVPIRHLWSLAVEEHFYLAAGLILPSLAAAGRLSPPRLIKATVGLILGAWALRVIAMSLDVPYRELQWQTQYRVDALGVGVLLAVVFVYFPNRFSRLGRHPWLLGAIALACFGVLGATRELAAFRVAFGYSLAWLGSAALLLLMQGRSLPLWALAPARVLAWLGLYSYSLYIWHIGAGRIVGARLASLLNLHGPVAIVCLRYASAILVAFIITKLVERPALMLRDRLFPAARSRTPGEKRNDSAETASRADVGY